MQENNNLVISTQGRIGIICLDRTTHLNALSLEMIQGIQAQLELWREDTQIQAILITSSNSKAFCVGGDIRYLYDSFQLGNQGHQTYFATEYAMLDTIRHYPKTVVAFLDGYVLGGGFGLAQACHIQISSEKSRFAMPETIIGFFPDVGATYFLSRLDEVGVYLALTGEQISCGDALHLDLVDYHVPSEQLMALQTALITEPNLNKTKIIEVISRFISNPVESDLKKYSDHIQKHFIFENLNEIEQSLAEEKSTADQVWAKKTLEILQKRPMMAKRTSLKLQQVGQSLSLEKCMQLERNLQDIWMEQGDFIEGVRALLVDKDKKPQWKTDNSTFEKTLERLWSAA